MAGVRPAGENGPVSALGFCCSTLTLAVGYACGLVRINSFFHSSMVAYFNVVVTLLFYSVGI